jgi:hypothetical protein
MPLNFLKHAGGAALAHGRSSDLPPRKTVLDDLLQLDLVALDRQGLHPGHQTTLRWPQAHGEPLRVDLKVEADALLLRPAMADTEGTPSWHRIRLTRIRQRLGGERLWLLCPGCQQRCRILYWTTSFSCRRCVGLSYASQHQYADERLLFRAKTIRARLGGSGSMLEPFPDRPKNMRRITYEKLRAKDRILDHGSLMAIAKRLRLPDFGRG